MGSKERAQAGEIMRLLGEYACWFIHLAKQEQETHIFTLELYGDYDDAFMLKALQGYTL
jgi:hypothetical protein